jgi:hypothetical protein
VAAFADIEPATLAILAGVQLLAEIEEGRIALDRPGWDTAMAERARLVDRQIAGTLSRGQAEALAALQRLQLAQVGQTPNGAVITPTYALADLHDTIAGLRLAVRETPHA